MFLLNFGSGQGLKFLREHNFFCYIPNLEHRIFPVSPLLHLPLTELFSHSKINFSMGLLKSEVSCPAITRSCREHREPSRIL